ncbi:MAG: ABC transporter permease subunit [Nocardioidaceae bacterium]
MSVDVLRKDLRERTVAVLVLGLAVGVLSLFALGVYAGMSGTLDELTKRFPPELMAFIGGDAPGGYVVGEVFNLIAPLALVTYAVMTGASAIAGEEERKTMGVLLGVPLRRRDLLLSKAVGLSVGLAVATGLFLVATVVASTAFDVGLRTADVAATGAHLGLLALLFGVLALAVGAATGRPALAAGVTGLLAVTSYLADSMLPLVGLERWAELSPWYYYAGSNPLSNGFDLPNAVVLAALTVLALTAAVLAFDRRDLRG